MKKVLKLIIYILIGITIVYFVQGVKETFFSNDAMKMISVNELRRCGIISWRSKEL